MYFLYIFWNSLIYYKTAHDPNYARRIARRIVLSAARPRLYRRGTATSNWNIKIWSSQSDNKKQDKSKTEIDTLGCRSHHILICQENV